MTRMVAALFKRYVTDVRERANAAIEPVGAESDRRAVIVLMTAALCLLAIRFGGHSYETGWLSSLLGALGLEELGSRLIWALESSEDARIYRRLYWASFRILFYVVVPVFVARVVLRERLSELGVRLRGTLGFAPVYFALLAVLAPFVVFASTTPAFQASYPFYELAPGEPLWPWFWAWELLYALQFVSLELFFRGFLLHGLAKRFGYTAIFVMMVPYMMIHFQKPFLEAAGSIVAGFVLGTLALASRSIWWGAFAHVLVALSMDFLSLWHRDLL